MTLPNGNIFRVTGPLWGESTGESSSQSQRRRALMFSLICAWTGGWANNWISGDLKCHRSNYDVMVSTYNRVVGDCIRKTTEPAAVRLIFLFWFYTQSLYEQVDNDTTPCGGDEMIFLTIFDKTDLVGHIRFHSVTNTLNTISAGPFITQGNMI